MEPLPLIESLACPACGAMKLRPNEDGTGADCLECGQIVIFEDDDDGGAGGRKRRNYTPDHRTHAPKPEPKVSSLPAHLDVHVWEPADHRGPLPAKPGVQELASSPIVPSHAMQYARRMKWIKVIAVLVVLALVGSVVVMSISDHRAERADPPGGRRNEQAAGKGNPLLANSQATGSLDDAEIAEARLMLSQRVLSAKSWEDWLPYVRHRGIVEPLMREHYARHAFVSFGAMAIGKAQPMVNERGRFVAFLLDPDQTVVAMVEVTDKGPLIDWEILVNYPLIQWAEFIAKRPDGETNLAVTFSRCYVRDEFLTESEKPVRDQLLGLRVGIPGNDDPLFAAVPVVSDLGRWVVAHVPWEHENKVAPVRADFVLDPAHAAMPGRVEVRSIPVNGWNR